MTLICTGPDTYIGFCLFVFCLFLFVFLGYTEENMKPTVQGGVCTTGAVIQPASVLLENNGRGFTTTLPHAVAIFIWDTQLPVPNILSPDMQSK